MKLSVCLPLSLLLFAATVVAAEMTWDSEFDNTLYNTPKGWATTQKSGAQMLIPPDLKEGEQVAIVITPGGELTGELKDALAQFRAELRGDSKATESKVESITSDEGYPVMYVAEQLQDDKGAATQFRYFFASHPGTRVEFVVFIANTQEAYTRYGKTFEEFVKTLSYKNARPGGAPDQCPDHPEVILPVWGSVCQPLRSSDRFDFMPAKIPPLRTRQIHLDFHTSPFIRDVGVDFDPRKFASIMKAAHVNSVTVFAKCHHGHLYYNTKHEARHPGLKKGFDLLRAQVDALHRVGIRAPIYISVLCDEYAADTHPEWIAREPDGRPVGAGPLQPGWQILDMAGPYQAYLAEQTAEILKLFAPVDGVFFDMCWDQPSLSNEAVEAMSSKNLDPENEGDRLTFAHELSLQYMKRFFNMVRASSKDATVFFNGRPYWRMRDDLPYQTQAEIEALPTGGWGYLYFPKNVRFARTLGIPRLGMTARFHKSWADFGGLKPYAALEYETSQMISLGAACSVGDQLHPRGTLDRGAYELIGQAYARVEAREPWIEGAVPVSQIGVFQIPAGTRVNEGVSGADEGAARMLMQLKHQFDMIDSQSSIDDYEMLILPDRVALDAKLIAKIRAFVRRGGALLATGFSGVDSEGTRCLLDLPIVPRGISPFQTTYIRFENEIALDVPPSDHVMYERGLRVTPSAGARRLAGVVEPYFDRSWKHFSSHFQTPADKLSKFSAAVIKGRVGYIAYPIFSAFHAHGNVPFKLLVRNLLNLLLPEPLLRIAAPSTTEATMMRQKNRTVVHILQYVPQRRTQKLDLVEDIIPILDIPLSVKLPKAPRRVYLAPEKLPLPFEYLHGRVNLRVPRIDGHAMVVFE